ncbi:MAG: hypothetical protein ACI4Q9_04005, partial [Candidatus Methanomethylophilaceae archaeon]
INIELDFGSAMEGKVHTLTGDSVTASGYKATIAVGPGDAVVSTTDMSASGRGVFNDLGEMPVIVWVLFALAIVLAILTVWMASKRGVFARRK